MPSNVGGKAIAEARPPSRMQTLALTLQDQDLGQLRIVASLWGLDLPTGTATQAAAALAGSMLDRSLLTEIVDSLPVGAHDALMSLIRNQGRLPLADLTRKYGSLRQMGPGRRDREQPWRNGTSPIEALWYRGLIARAFMDTPTGPQEFGYVPPDLAALLPPPQPTRESLAVEPIQPPKDVRLATDFAVDDAVTILAALRRRPAASTGLSLDRLQGLQPFLHQPRSASLLLACLFEDRVLADEGRAPDPEAVRALLDSTRTEIMHRIRNAWRRAPAWNDLAQVPDLHPASGEWPNDPLVSRQAVLSLLSGLSVAVWWDLHGFIQAVYDSKPAFQRPAGDFDSWYLLDLRTGSFVRGLAHWHAVEGALIRGVITGPLHWMGMLDLGLGGADGPTVAFRLTPGFAPSSRPEAPPPTLANQPARVRPEGLITVPRLSSPAMRYQIARICDWESRDAETYNYRLTPNGLAAAASQGLQPSHVRTILESASGSPLPRSVALALERWSESGTQARMERMLVFTVEKPALLEDLRANRSTARFLHELLGPRSARVAERDWRKLCEAAARLGILIEPPHPTDGSAP